MLLMYAHLCSMINQVNLIILLIMMYIYSLRPKKVNIKLNVTYAYPDSLSHPVLYWFFIEQREYVTSNCFQIFNLFLLISRDLQRK